MTRRFLLVLVLLAGTCCSPSACPTSECYYSQREGLRRGAYEMGNYGGSLMGSTVSGSRPRTPRLRSAVRPAYNTWLDYQINQLLGPP